MELDIESIRYICAFEDSYAYYKWSVSLTEHEDIDTGGKLYKIDGYVVDSRIGDDVDTLHIEFLFDYPKDPREYFNDAGFPLFDGIRSVIERVHGSFNDDSLDVAEAKIELKIVASSLCAFFETVHRKMLADDVPSLKKDKFGVFTCVTMYENTTIITSSWLLDELITNKQTRDND